MLERLRRRQRAAEAQTRTALLQLGLKTAGCCMPKPMIRFVLKLNLRGFADVVL